MAYDHSTGYMWSGNGYGTAWEMDFEAQSIISTITGSWSCRAITYEREDDCLYVSGWGDPVWKLDKDGTIIESFNLVLTTSTYGFAYDKWDTNFAGLLWVHDQGGTGSEIRAYDLEAEEFVEGEDYYHNVQLEIPGGIAGGLALAEWGFGAYSSFVACSQASPDAIAVYEWYITIPPEHDIGVKKIVYPETGYAVENVPMQTIFINNGNHSETFDAQMTIIKCEVSDAPLLLENFSTYGAGPRGLPVNWSTDWWKWSGTYQASDDPAMTGEARCYYWDQRSGGDYYDNYIVGPKVNCSGLEKVTFTFALFQDVQYTCYMYLKYRQNESSSWRDVTPWENPIPGDTRDWYTIGCYGFQTGGDIGSEFQFNFSYQGYYNNFRNWYLDSCRIDPCGGCAEYAEIVEDITIPSGEEKTVDFPDWTPSEWQNETSENSYEEYPVSAEHFLDDDIAQNDIKYKLITLYFPWMDDVAALTIDGLASGPAQTFGMDGIIKNVGQNDECCFKTHITVQEIDYANPVQLFFEHFNGYYYSPPSGWTKIGNYYAWYWSQYYYYYIPAPYGTYKVTRLYYYYSPGAELISPVIDTSDYGSVEMMMGNAVQYYTAGIDLIIEVRGDPSATWAQIQPWENPVTSNMQADWIYCDATIGIGEQTQFRFRSDGTYYNFRYWLFDNMKVTGLEVFDPEYEEEVCIEKIIPGEEKTLAFDDWTPDFLQYETSGEKTYIAKMWTALKDPLDKNPANDLYQITLTLDYFHDVEVTYVTSLEPYEPDDGSREKLFTQRAYTPSEQWAFYASSTTLGYICDDDFYDLSKKGNEIEFYGLSLVFPWSNCDPTGMEFEFKQYEYGTSPGAVEWEDSGIVLETWINTGWYYSGFECLVWEYGGFNADEGWISIQSTYSPNNCNFLWLGSPEGNFNARQNGNSLYDSLAFNITDDGGCWGGIPYITPGIKDIDVLVSNRGTFPEFDLSCNAKIYEYITNCTYRTLVYEDNISDIDLEEPLGGSEELYFNDFNFSLEGLYRLFLNLKDDNDDNPKNNKYVLRIGVDDTPPSSYHTLDPPEPDGDNGWYKNFPSVTIYAKDPRIPCGYDGSGVAYIEVRIDGGSWTSFLPGECTFIFGDDGDNVYIEYRAVDNVGNYEEINSFTIDIDQTTPVASEISWDAYKKGGFWYVDLTAHATDEISLMNRVEFFINDGLQEIIEGRGPDYVFTIQWSLDFPKHSFFFYHYDDAGNVIMVYFNPGNVTAYQNSQFQQQKSYPLNKSANR